MNLETSTEVFIDALRQTAIDVLGHGEFQIQITVAVGTKPEDQAKAIAINHLIEAAMKRTNPIRTSLQ